MEYLVWAFVCGAVIGVKSKYSCCRGTCSELIKINNTPLKITPNRESELVNTVINIYSWFESRHWFMLNRIIKLNNLVDTVSSRCEFIIFNLRVYLILLLCQSIISFINIGTSIDSGIYQSMLVYIGNNQYLFNDSEADFAMVIGLTVVRTYSDAEAFKNLALNENKGESGIYLWTNNITGGSFVGSAVDLTKRLRQYYSPGFLKK